MGSSSPPHLIPLRLTQGTVPVYFGTGMTMADFLDCCVYPIQPDAVGIISDQNVFAAHGAVLCEAVTSAGFSPLVEVLPAGEETKSLAFADHLYGALTRAGFTRHSLLIALGGGVIGDLTGFVAATYMRGLRQIQVPTSLLAQVDSAVGGKTAVNHALAKNLIGLFSHPQAVWVDTAHLATLPETEFQHALGEVIKYGATLDADLFDMLASCSEHRILRRDHGKIRHIVETCLHLKIRIVAQDEREASLRKVLNFGHTYGHAIEIASGFAIPHGVAVGWGIVLAQQLGVQLGYVSESWSNCLAEVVRKLLPRPTLSGLSASAVLELMRRDKKNASGHLFFVFSPEKGQQRMITDVDEGSVVDVWNSFCKKEFQ